jgi:hypothetical protein
MAITDLEGSVIEATAENMSEYEIGTEDLDSVVHELKAQQARPDDSVPRSEELARKEQESSQINNQGAKAQLKFLAEEIGLVETLKLMGASVELENPEFVVVLRSPNDEEESAPWIYRTEAFVEWFNGVFSRKAVGAPETAPPAVETERYERAAQKLWGMGYTLHIC